MDFKSQLTAIKDDFSVQTQSVLALVARMDSMMGEQREQKRAINDHSSQLETMEKLAEMEDHSHRNNIRLVGLPEGTEGSGPIGFIQKAIKDWFPSLENSEIEVARAHRVYRGAKDPCTSPRVFMFKLLRYQDRQRLLKASRSHGPISSSGSTLLTTALLHQGGECLSPRFRNL